jgi:hypothetical protein
MISMARLLGNELSDEAAPSIQTRQLAGGAFEHFEKIL